jgi:hypothetical protein
MKTQADVDQVSCTRDGCSKTVHVSKAIWKDGDPLCSRACFDKKFKKTTPDVAPNIVPLQEDK